MSETTKFRWEYKSRLFSLQAKNVLGFEETSLGQTLIVTSFGVYLTLEGVDTLRTRHQAILEESSFTSVPKEDPDDLIL